MLGVMIAHFGWIFSSLHADFTFGIAMSHYLEFSAPTFMLVSGALLGYVYEMRNRELGNFALKLMDRGLFLLTVGHLIIMAAYISYAGERGGAIRFGQITDAIGLAIIIGPILIVQFNARKRVLIGVSLFVLTWVGIEFLQPQSAIGLFFKDTLFGAELQRRSSWSYNFPLIPWISVYIVATALGQRLAALRKTDNDSAFIRQLLKFAAIGLAATLLMKLAWVGVDSVMELEHSVGSVGHFVYTLIDPFQKWPPSPAYIIYHCSLAMLLLATLFFLERKGLFSRLLAMLGVIGKNSLFVFLFQEHVYVSLLWMVNPPFNQYWVGILASTIALNIAAVYAWNHYASAKFFTVGFGTLWGPRTFNTPEKISTHSRPD